MIYHVFYELQFLRYHKEEVNLKQKENKFSINVIILALTYTKKIFEH